MVPKVRERCPTCGGRIGKATPITFGAFKTKVEYDYLLRLINLQIETIDRLSKKCSANWYRKQVKDKL
jgi:hypothetical protein